MATEFKLPELGENIAGGDIVNVLVHEGQTIAANDGVFELETDKAVIEVPCPHAGKIAKILVKKGASVKVGQTLLLVEADSTKPPPAAPIKPPPVVAPAAAAGTAAPQVAAAPAVGPLPAGPAARRVARELGVDIARVQGTGERGRITPEDVRATKPPPVVAPTKPPPLVAPGAASAARDAAEAASYESARRSGTAFYQAVEVPGESGQDAWGPVRRDRMSKIRQTIAAQMVRSASTIPHVTNFDDADVTDLESLRRGVPQGFVGPNLKLTTMPFVMKAVALALRRHPLLNASLDEEQQQVVYKQYVNLGVAVDTPRGLVVPNVRGVDRLSIPEIARALAVLAERARAAQFAIEELRGGTFTISNLGAVGGAYSTPIINHPEVAILLLGRTRWLPVVRDGRTEPRLMMPLSLSFDHRVVDGAAAGRFLNDVIDLLQSPGKLLLAN
jgi:pyruvate dehydrogenase E2 component (dihydrolipoamide acetyltransferase)